MTIFHLSFYTNNYTDYITNTLINTLIQNKFTGGIYEQDIHNFITYSYFYS